MFRYVASPLSRQWGRGRMAAEGERSLGLARDSPPASMGPRPDGRGRVCPGGPTRASESRQWGRGRMAAEGANAAATAVHRRASMGPRPDGRGRRHAVGKGAAPVGRQWGRGRMAAEGPPLALSPLCLGVASMGPRPDGRGRVVDQHHLVVGPVASMGPRPDGRGRAYTTEPEKRVAPRQWGRGRMAAEGPLQRAICPVPRTIAHDRQRHALYTKHLFPWAPAGYSALLPHCERPARRAPCRGRSHAPDRPHITNDGLRPPVGSAAPIVSTRPGPVPYEGPVSTTSTRSSA